MNAPFRTTKRIEFRDTDAGGIAHFTAFFGYMEEAEHAMLRHVGLSVVMEDDDGVISWPRVSAHCDYRAPARFEDELDVEVYVDEISEKAVTYGFRFTRDETEIAEGRLVAVCCRIDPATGPRSITIPEEVVTKLRTLTRAE